MKLSAALAVAAFTALLVNAPLTARADTAPSSDPQPELAQQRELYSKAVKALRRGPDRRFQRYKRQLKDYPLYPYLEYAELSIGIRTLPRRKVEKFLSDYDGTRIADRMRVRWLQELKRRRRGSDFTRYYRADIASTELQCYYQYARHRTGDETQQNSALEQGLKLWLVGKSQPDGCDQLFELLRQRGRITSQLAWQRYSLATDNRKYQLARYLTRFITDAPYRAWATSAEAARNDPAKIGRYQHYRDRGPAMRTVIEHNLKRLARQNASRAMTYWAHYQQTHPFDAAAKSRVSDRLVKDLFNQQHPQAADQYLASSLQIVEPQLLEWRIRQALLAGDWQTAHQWINRLPGEYRSDNRWRYWHARLSEQIDGSDPAQVYAELAQRRSYYGFLASERLGGEYAMEHNPIAPTEAEINAVEQLPGIQIARELRHHNDQLNARREWRDATRQFSEAQWLAAAVMTARWGWTNQSIMSMVQASYWNDIQIRFPLSYQPLMERYSEPLKLESQLVLALARQESALAEDAISPAGARGLMQLMPATARQTARRYNIRYRNSNDLLTPEKNIELGTRYYRELMDRFGNNRILATAAYNAGPHRVKQWRQKSAEQLPFDAWIEVIPFKETRGYVQNVLAFSAIYGHLLDNGARMLSEAEMTQLL